MASGRKDYWQGVSPERGVLGPDQTYFYSNASKSIDPANEEAIIDGSVGASVVRYITQIIVSVANPGTHRIKLTLGARTMLYFWFDTYILIPFPMESNIPITAGGAIKVEIYNGDTEEQEFRCHMFGFSQSITP